MPLEISFRSTEPVLRAVDAVFRATAARRRRRARRQRDPPYRGPRRAAGRRRAVAAGRSPAAEEPLDPTALPVARQRSAEPRTRLASAIAATIARLARQRRAARGARPADPAGRHHGAGAAAQRVRRRPAARAEAARRAGRRRRPPGADRAARGAGPGGARPVPAAAGGRSDPGGGAEGPALRHRRGELFDLAYDRGEREAVAAAARALPANDRSCAAAVERLARSAAPAPISCRPTSSTPRSSARGAGGARCWSGSGPRPPTRSRSSSPWRSPTSASMCRRCRAFCTGWSPATSRSSAISASGSATRCAS